MKVRAGQLRLFARILRPQSAQDDFGGPIIQYSHAGERYCSQLVSRPSEISTDAGVRHSLFSRFLFRMDSLTALIGPRWRLEIGDFVFDVIGSEHNPSDGSVIVTAEVRVA